ncbi:hypothetical protein F0L74_09335 [Chitinophaga agrisoli]|uniref:Uncharacterized protein n=1 Tax=Chitinophaga agrisoli TaxID=2607653 RepID=A0A5B2VVL0_9BACT|nr:hypothetical protein [Chitinophaga agrisoli]KAA2242720.1 hypothetical protein F0L74_09335 [Chitinophaga agrisoli]
MTFTSCKKDDKDTSPRQASGTFSAFEAEVNGEVLALPTASEKMEVKIDIADDTHANVTVTYYNGGQQQSTPPIACTMGKDPDGFLTLSETSTGNMFVLYYDEETIDCFPSPGDRLSASRSGKKPDWWDD